MRGRKTASEAEGCNPAAPAASPRRIAAACMVGTAVRSLPEALEATPEIIITAGDFRLVGSPIHVSGYDPDYRPPPELPEA
ncbi:hypothetical protein A5695_06820 [Mycobacterium sp. E1747]|nr:hypothetical protein A5695_06820 [Mycobacterium sp. E1747]